MTSNRSQALAHKCVVKTCLYLLKSLLFASKKEVMQVDPSDQRPYNYTGTIIMNEKMQHLILSQKHNCYYH